MTYILIINIVSFILMVWDKFLAKKHKRRISEATLLGVAAVGGSLGAICGMYLVRHKTKHAKFRFGLPAIFIAQVVLFLILRNYL